MNLKKELLKILLLQSRVDQDMVQIERLNFLQFLDLSPDQIITLDLYREPDFNPEILNDYDAFLMGGLSDDPKNSAIINKEIFPFLDSLQDLLSFAVNNDIPGLLSCGGFMLGSHLLGARVELDEAQKELGVYDIHLTPMGQRDPLTRHLPSPFNMISGHNKSVMSLPPGCELLGSSDRCKIHIFKRTGTRIYAFQGHPEITCRGLKQRIEPYRDKYFNDLETFHKVINLEDDTSLSNELLQKFIDKIVLSR